MSVEDKLDRLMRRVYTGPQPQIYGQKYFYVLGFTKKGKKVFWGPMMDETDAYAALAELQDGEKFELDTRDPRRAVREVRDLLIKRGTDPDEALRRMLHKRDIDKDVGGKGIVSKLFRGRPVPKSRAPMMEPTLPPRSIMNREDK